jgi:hypothetical protein
MVVAILALAIAAFAAAGLRANTDEDGIEASGGGDFVERLIPGRGDEIQRQSTIGIDLSSGWTGGLSLKRPGDTTFVPLPEDEVQVRPELNQLLYTSDESTPGPDLQAGTNCVLATVFKIASPDQTKNVSWCFEVT